MVCSNQPQQMSMFGQNTQDGYPFGECVSALQKCIRRGQTREAVYWAVEIEGCGGKEASYLWHRLKVICSEDIGPTPEGNQVTILVSTLGESYADARKRKNRATRLFLVHAIIAMCAAPKTRVADYLGHAVYRQTERYEIPDVALDKHTARGRRMGRGQEHFLSEGQHIENASDLFEPECSEWEREFQDHCLKDSPWRGFMGTLINGPEAKQEGLGLG